ncbi:phosphatase PAP2/dual specificity phosphatase family protein [Lysobacter sp. H23M47]|uniref:phosphatase PAP2/dual specificity phosphatase family protein n=1 Tax=Lysobacter sp. H23M47 TaxID=2781024 RepID=UPI00187E0442|nr:phosphatase PAP2/dual specificity phosphatase family protein [Lysobacter sp. H23M47]QOW24893.1 phosphatase PAP2/dual specificity phosphatase family protein [Lysobacter sp. H23M47]
MSVSTSRPWRRALAWLALLGPFFYLSYGFANHVAEQRDVVRSIVFAWEHRIPFVAWTIVPYWTTNLFYAVSMFLCRDRRELDTHALRLLSVQVLAVSCFLLWPLRVSFEAPVVEGLFGGMFAALKSFDQPYNQAPSLHIALTVILWVRYNKHLRGIWQALLHVWFTLVCVSVLTTYQHHFIDVPTGIAAGWLCVWLWPEGTPAPWRAARWSGDPRRWRLAVGYAVASVVLAWLGTAVGSSALWLWWPALSLALVALNYALLGPSGFQKRSDGRLSTAARWLYAPYLAVAWINSRAWTRRQPAPVEVADGVWLGRIPSRADREGFQVVDVCAELSLPGGARPGDTVVPMLDLVTPDPARLQQAIRAIPHHPGLPVLVCCALGYSRSATVIAGWLLHTGRAPTVEAACGIVRAARASVVLGEAQLQVLRGTFAAAAAGNSAATGDFA